MASGRITSAIVSQIAVAILVITVLMPQQYDQTHEYRHYSYDNTGAYFTPNPDTLLIVRDVNDREWYVLDHNYNQIPLQDYQPYKSNVPDISYSIDYSKPYATQGGVDIQLIQTAFVPNSYVVLIGASNTPETDYESGITPSTAIQLSETVERGLIVFLDGVKEVRGGFISDVRWCDQVYFPDSVRLNGDYGQVISSTQSITKIKIGQNTVCHPSLSSVMGSAIRWVDYTGQNIDTSSTNLTKGSYQHLPSMTVCRQLPSEDDRYSVIAFCTLANTQDSMLVLNENAKSLMFIDGSKGECIMYYGINADNPKQLVITDNQLILDRPQDEGGIFTVRLEYQITQDTNAPYVYGSGEHVNPDNIEYYSNYISISNGIIIGYMHYTINGSQHQWCSGWGQIANAGTTVTNKINGDNVLTNYSINVSYNNGKQVKTLQFQSDYVLTYRHIEWDHNWEDGTIYAIYEVIFIMAALAAQYCVVKPMMINNRSREYDW